MVKVEDKEVRDWLSVNFFPKHKCVKNIDWTTNQFEWCDAEITSNTDAHYYLEVKTRTVKSTDFNGETMIEEDKFNELKEHEGEVGLLILFTDCICWFPPSKLFETFVRFDKRWCPDETKPKTEKKWRKVLKTVGLFDTNKAIKFNYKDYGGTPQHLFKSPYSG